MWKTRPELLRFPDLYLVQASHNVVCDYVISLSHDLRSHSFLDYFTVDLSYAALPAGLWAFANTRDLEALSHQYRVQDAWIHRRGTLLSGRRTMSLRADLCTLGDHKGLLRCAGPCKLRQYKIFFPLAFGVMFYLLCPKLVLVVTEL